MTRIHLDYVTELVRQEREREMLFLVLKFSIVKFNRQKSLKFLFFYMRYADACLSVSS